MARWAGTTTARGLGTDHQRLRKHKLAVLVLKPFGEPCRRCGQVMLHPTNCPDGPCWICTLDLGHEVPRALAGPIPQGARELEHRKCNRSAGTRLGNKLRRQQRGTKRQHSRRW